MFAPDKEYLYTSYTYCLQNENSWAVCCQLSQEKSQPFQERSQLFPIVRVNLFSTKTCCHTVQYYSITVYHLELL